MGYYTRYTLTIERHDGCGHWAPEGAKYCPECGLELSIDDAVNHMIREAVGGRLSDSRYKWYHHEYDMRVISASFPGWLFTLHGEGEATEDIWTSYFLNGRMQTEVAQIVIGEFDESKLDQCTLVQFAESGGQ